MWTSVEIPEDFQYMLEPITEVEGVQDETHEPSQEMDTVVIADQTTNDAEGGTLAQGY